MIRSPNQYQCRRRCPNIISNISNIIQPWIQVTYGNDLYPDADGISPGEGLPQSEETLEAWVKYKGAGNAFL